MKQKHSFKKVVLIEVHCVKCGAGYERTDTDIIPLFRSITNAKYAVKESGWKVKGEQAICPDCQ